MENDVERALPSELIRRASLRGGEYAWQLHDIPEVIEAARAARLVNIGGQLQFRLPDGGICECYWIEVDALREVDAASPRETIVQLSADAAQREFSSLPPPESLLRQGRASFDEHLGTAKISDDDLSACMCFVWYFE